MTNKEFKVSIKDFQIIKNADLTFLPGLNAIIGQSNNGKSAILRAIKSCIYNTPGTTYVQIGKNNYAVGIQANEHTVILQKGQANLYKIDGKLYEKIGRTQLPEVAQALGIADLNLNGVSEQINFQDQMEKPFLLDRSETDLFRFIVDSGKDSNVTNALKTLSQDRQQLTRDITTTEGALAQIEKDLEEQNEKILNADMKIDVCTGIINMGPKISQLNNMKSLSKSIKDSTETKIMLSNKIIKLTSTLDNLESVKSDVELNIKKRNLINTLLNSILVNKDKKNSLSTNVELIETITSSELEKLFNRYKSTTELLKSLKSSKNSLTELNNIRVPDVDPDIEKYIESLKLINRIQSNINIKNAYNKDIEDITSKLDTLQEEINAVGVCPTCGKPLHN